MTGRDRRYLMYGLVFAVVWGIGFARLRHSDATPVRDSAESLLQDAQPVEAFASHWVGETFGLMGGVVFVEQRPYPHHRVARVDFETGVMDSVFDVPEGGLVYHIAATSDPDTLLMSYSPPDVGYDRSGIYTLSLSDGHVERVLGGETSATYYANPQQGGESIVYAVYDRAAQTRCIERYNTRTGAIERIADDAVMPVVSADGATIAYVHVSATNGARSLWVRGTDGTARQAVGEGDFTDIDAPMLSPDGAWLYFTVLEPQPLISRALQVVFGATPTHAHGNHNLPMRWYRVPLTGGTPQPVTTTPFITLYGGLSVGHTLGFVSDTGFYVAHAGQTQHLIQSRVMRSFVWMTDRP